MTGEQGGPGPKLNLRDWPALGVGIVLIFAIVIAGGVFALGALRSGASPSALSTGNAAATATPLPPLPTPRPLVATTYMCGGAAYVPDAYPATTASAEARIKLEALTGRLGAILPAAGWHIWSSSADRLVFIAPNEKTSSPFAFVEMKKAGPDWLATSYGDCEPAAPQPSVPSELVVGQWYLPARPAIGSQVVQLEFRLDFCDELLVGPTIWYSSSSVTVTMWGRRTPSVEGASPCPEIAYQAVPYTLALAEPLGGRKLLVGPSTAAKPAGPEPTPARTPTPKPSASKPVK
jgi:hypothetical protein